MIELVAAHGAQVKLKALEMHNQRRGELLYGASTLGRHTLPTLLAQVTVISLTPSDKEKSK